MDFVEPVLGLAQELYSLCAAVKANKMRCQRLARRVEALMVPVQVIRVRGPGGQPEAVSRALRELKGTLESGRELVRRYASASCLKRILRVGDLGEEFETLNERLNDAAQVLSLALQADQKARLESVFRESARRGEDSADRESDHRELQKLLSISEDTNSRMKAVEETVDSTQKDVEQIRGLLESLMRPSLHLQDIREIRVDELTYDSKPILTTGNSELYKGEYNKFTVAIKRYTYPLNTSPQQLRKIFNKEVETMKRFESPNILRMFGICVLNEDGPSPGYLIVMEYCEKGCLRQVLDKKPLSWEIRTQMCLDAAQGLYRLHQSEEKFRVHGSINSSKFLVDAGYRVKLGGFELAKTETSLRKNRDQTRTCLAYSSPQQLESINHQYDRPCEIYSFGIVLWEVATRNVPFEGCSHSQIYQKVCVERQAEPLPPDCPEHLAELIDDCRSYDPFHRPTAGVLVDKLRRAVREAEED
ncbi:mixed lineage kinase domain-like protein isoform X2 [Lepisosteus oculatus]|uniref:Mixed lineage kinase domain like pseudokinase n=2 Tax=Lepisosteus oculatus TaxID=7918 RepID=W5LZX6_LEPOC|nr:PREDICTED: mixed lineage kinase domain-like protein isoform X2 [Lepisosteus oculatus]XP_015223779.1 PREDICTED: mixed lineage kinase domain-like protein isoform X2 [Lepisosteus oculatus]XP_015223780.1 PREDICTED: mixed lineage kinase domain-like protein isoform X2 [Lepisosteus oculatus]XP_015223781.1 PREDICTED: mixed lineage kinase domain-like protein isoform X2 [Lepisosteus oculatus]